MQILGTIAVGLFALNAMIFVALYFLRRSRPEKRARLFSWVLHGRATGSRRRPHHGIPA